MQIRLSIFSDCDEHRLTAIVRLLEAEIDLKVVTQSLNGKYLIDQLSRVNPHVYIVDIQSPTGETFDMMKNIVKYHSTAKIISSTSYDLESEIIEMYRLGVHGIIGKDEDVEKLFTAVRVAHSGGTYLTDKARKVIQRYLDKKRETECSFHLSQRERVLIKELQMGRSSTEIGIIINRSPRTVEDMRAKLYQKFNVFNKEQLISLTSKWGVVDGTL